MGCEVSMLQTTEPQNDIEKSPSEEFKLTYRQFIMNSRGEVFDFYHFSTLVHRSSSCIIRRTFHRTTKVERICKIVTVQNLQQLRCIQQPEIIKSLEHPNIVHMHEYFIEKKFVYLIFDSLKGGNLFQKLSTMEEIRLSNIITIMTQILSAVNMMHKQRIAHRSLNPSHIMLNEKQKEFTVKIISFGYATYVGQQQARNVPPYEQSAYNSTESTSHPIEHDIYCCGLIFLTLLGGHKFLKDIRGREEKNIDQFLDEHPHLSSLHSLLLMMLQKQPKERKSAAQILSHEKFKGEEKDLQKIQIVFKKLLKFNIQGKLKSTLWMFATVTLNNIGNKTEFLNEFYNLDKNKDGKIDYEELCEGIMNTFSMSREVAAAQTKQIFAKLDKNMNGCLDYYEFVLGTYSVGKDFTENELMMIFKEIDVNKDGVITEQELNGTIEGIEEFNLLANKGNQIDFKDFKNIMKSFIVRMSGMNH